MAQASLNIKLLPELRARALVCAKAEGVSLPEYARLALRMACEQTERREGQRSRLAAKLADDGGEGARP